MTESAKWRKITCAEREQLIDALGRSYNGLARPYGVLAGRTDLTGEYGRPEIFTEWGHLETDVPVLRDVRYPSPTGGADTAPCEHYAPETVDPAQSPD